MNKYDILEWSDFFDKSKNKVDEKTDFLDSRSIVLYPGRFYVLNYIINNTRDRYNMRPVIISMGVSKKDPDSFLCIDLSVLPKQVRLKFIDIYFKLYSNEIWKNFNEHMFVDDADNQEYMKTFSYENICKATPFIPLKFAIKRYKIKNVKKIYSLPFNVVYKVIGNYSDENYYKNGNISDVQKEFLKKMQR